MQVLGRALAGNGAAAGRGVPGEAHGGSGAPHLRGPGQHLPGSQQVLLNPDAALKGLQHLIAVWECIIATVASAISSNLRNNPSPADTFLG